jgi:hypothetical protein
VIGYTDSGDAPQADVLLSQQPAQAVADALVANGGQHAVGRGPCVGKRASSLIEIVSHLVEHTLAYSASVGNLSKAPFQLIKFCLSQIFEGQQLVAGSCAHSDQLVQLKLNSGTIAVLRVLD